MDMLPWLGPYLLSLLAILGIAYYYVLWWYLFVAFTVCFIGSLLLWWKDERRWKRYQRNNNVMDVSYIGVKRVNEPE